MTSTAFSFGFVSRISPIVRLLRFYAAKPNLPNMSISTMTSSFGRQTRLSTLSLLYRFMFNF